MTLSREPDDSDIFARLAQIEYRLARLESIQARQPLVPGGYVNEIGEQFKTTLDNLLDRRIDRVDSEEARNKARHDEEANKARQDKAAEDKARQDETMRKLDLILELIEKIDWTKYRNTETDG